MTKTRLEALLNHLLERSESDETTNIDAGDFRLSDNEAFTLQLLDQYADLVDKFPRYTDFKRMFEDERFTEKEPKPTDSSFQFTNEGLDEKTRQTKQAYFYLKAKQHYAQRFGDHQAVQTRSRAFTQNTDASFRGYVSAIDRPAVANDNQTYPQGLAEADRFFFNTPQIFHISEKNREKHTYITAASGHGKSVTIETLIHHYLTQNTNTAVVLLDPHGDLAQACAQLKPNLDNDRLVYIKPSHDRQITPTLNPFDLPSREWDTINKASDALIEVFKEVMKADGEGTNFTSQMTTILKPCLSALLHKRDTSFVDLMKMLDDDPAVYKPYLDYAKRVLTNPMHLDTLGRDFLKDTFNPSKLGIKTKVRNLLNDDYFYNFLVGKSTLNLKREINRKAVIIFDLSDLTKASKDAIGRFTMASLTTLAKSRGNLPYHRRTPIHLFVDECQNFISQSMESILTETRKFRLHGTFAQQFTGQGMDAQMKKAIIGNSAVKITGNNGVSDLKIMAAETGITVEEMQALNVGEFYIQSGKGKHCLRVKMPLLGKDTKMTKQEWKSVMEQQIDQYYRPIGKQKTQKLSSDKTNEASQNHSSKETSNLQAHGTKRGQDLDPDPLK